MNGKKQPVVREFVTAGCFRLDFETLSTKVDKVSVVEAYLN